MTLPVGHATENEPDAGPDWEWADLIPEEFVIRTGPHGTELRCTQHGALYAVGSIELWELAHDAHKHWREEHAS
jgi:hypothetical protein